MKGSAMYTLLRVPQAVPRDPRSGRPADAPPTAYPSLTMLHDAMPRAREAPTPVPGLSRSPRPTRTPCRHPWRVARNPVAPFTPPQSNVVVRTTSTERSVKSEGTGDLEWRWGAAVTACLH